MPSSSQDASNRGDYSHIPIPTYEEATSSRPSSSHRNYLGPSEISHDAERQGLLGGGNAGGEGTTSTGHGAPRPRGYRPPTVESARSSLDSDVVGNLPSDDEDDGRSARASMEELRREISEMEYDDGGQGSRSKWSARGFASAFNFRMRWNLTMPVRLPARVRAVLPSWQSVRSVLLSVPRSDLLRHIRFDASLLIRVFALMVVLGTGYLVFFADVLRVRNKSAHNHSFAALEDFVFRTLSDGAIRTNSYTVSRYIHLAGTRGSYTLGEWIEDRWKEYGLDDVHMDRYEVYLNWPTEGDRKVAIVQPEDKKWTAKLEEDAPDSNEKQTLVFHGHSKSGTAQGPLVYVNYGADDDFKKLKDLGVKTEGCIVLLRYGGSQPDRASKIKAAEANGAIGVIMYSDPNDQDRNMDAFNGQWRRDDAVDRGSVTDMAMVLGDVLSPGFASTSEEKQRLSVDRARELGYLPKIPSIPLSWPDAQRLLGSLKGIGKDLRTNAPDFVGGIQYVDWWSGGEGSPVVLLQNENTENQRQPIFNVMGSMKGVEQPNSKVIVGSHYDAWCFGAVDPGSGISIMTEVVRVLAELRQAGWNPARTIEFASWDAEQYNVIGSTEYVEEHADDLRENAFAYVNVDIGAFGPDFVASATPGMERVIGRALDRIWDEKANTTLRQLWDDKRSILHTLGGGGDFAAFQHIAGIPSIDMGFRGSSFPSHSCRDEFALLDQTFDPGYNYHKLMAQVLTLVILELAEAPIMPFDLEYYAQRMSDYVKQLMIFAADYSADLDFTPLIDSVLLMQKSAQEFRNWEIDREQLIRVTSMETNVMAAERIEHNRRAANFEKRLLDLGKDGGLAGRQQFKHVIFSPRRSRAQGAEYFAGIKEPIAAKNWEEAKAQIAKVASLIEAAAKSLHSE